MKNRLRVFNGFLMAVLVALGAGCGTTEERQHKKELSTVRIHLESGSSAESHSTIEVVRSAPIRVNIERDSLLDERNLVAALVVDQVGGFAIELKFDRQGSWLLERVSVMDKGRRLAIHGYFGSGRWLAAPMITGLNPSGRLTFTADCTREEADRFVRGLNNFVQKAKRKENGFLTPFEQ